MAMTGFICHDDYYDRLKRLSNEEVGNLFRQLMLYHAGRYDEMSDFIDSEGIAFDFIANDIDRIEEKQNAISETNRLNGSKGGRPKKQTEPTETGENRQKPNITEAKPTESEQKANKDKDKDIYKKENPLKGVKEKASRFSPPTVDEVRAYCQERNNGIDAEAFVAFYASKGWKVGNSPMKDWKQCVITWEKRNVKKPVQNPVPIQAKTVVAQQYEQRDYTGVQDEILSRQRDEIAERIRQKYGGSA